MVTLFDLQQEAYRRYDRQTKGALLEKTQRNLDDVRLATYVPEGTNHIVQWRAVAEMVLCLAAYCEHEMISLTGAVNATLRDELPRPANPTPNSRG